MQILDLLGMNFDAAVICITSHLLLALAILWQLISQKSLILIINFHKGSVISLPKVELDKPLYPT